MLNGEHHCRFIISYSAALAYRFQHGFKAAAEIIAFVEDHLCA